MFQWAAQKTKARMQQKRKRQMTVVSRMTISEDKRRWPPTDSNYANKKGEARLFSCKNRWSTCTLLGINAYAICTETIKFSVAITENYLKKPKKPPNLKKKIWLREEFYGDSVDFDEAEYRRNSGSLQNSWRRGMHVKTSKYFFVAFWVHTTKAERETERESSTCSIPKKIVQKILHSTGQLIELKIFFILRLWEKSVEKRCKPLVMMALVWGGTLNSSAANLRTAVKGASSGTLKLHKHSWEGLINTPKETSLKKQNHHHDG